MKEEQDISDMSLKENGNWDENLKNAVDEKDWEEANTTSRNDYIKERILEYFEEVDIDDLIKESKIIVIK